MVKLQTLGIYQKELVFLKHLSHFCLSDGSSIEKELLR